MNLENIYFHNVVEFESVPGFNGKSLQRFPRLVRDALGKNGAAMAMQSSGCELRFVTEADPLRLTVSAYETDGDVLVFSGDYFHSSYRLKAGKPTAITLEKHEKFSGVDKSVLKTKSSRFSPDVWRVFFSHYCTIYHGVETFGESIRPPKKNEMPTLKWLAYGSSITHGLNATQNVNSYVQLAARELGVDVFNAGISGACRCEKEVADFFAYRKDWDFATFELGVNMRGVFSAQEFKKRVSYLLNGVINAHPDKKIFLITIFPNAVTYQKNETQASINERQYNDILRELHASLKHPRLYLIEGSDVVRDLSWLTVDLLHPSDMGHIDMGHRLASLLNRQLKK